MSKQELTNHYINYIKEFNMDIIHGMNEGDISHYEAEFPSNSEEMEAFISAFKHIFPHATHNFSRFKILLSGLTKMEEDNEFKDSELYLDIVDYIREEALEELQDQISKYPLLEDAKLFDFKSYIEELNEDLGFDGANSEVFETETTIESTIEGEHHTTITISLNKNKLVTHYRNNNLRKFVINEYYREVQNFSVDEEFNILYSSDFIKKMVEEDLAYFDVILNNHM